MMRTTGAVSRLLWGVLLIALFLPHQAARSSAPAPGQVSSEIREALFNAQAALAARPGEAEEYLSNATAAYAGTFSTAVENSAPQAHARILAGFRAAERALAQRDAPAFAAARAQVWTGILSAGYSITEQAVLRGDAEAARAWLAVREYRTATRLSRPAVGAALAIDGLQRGSISPGDAALGLRSDLFDAYQARLVETLHDLPLAAEQGFPARRAELASLAEGYFLILAPAYEQERGSAALQAALAAFGDLNAAVPSQQEISAPLARINAALKNFRAAPLTPEQQASRAGQLLRYISLIPVEYKRGVKDTADGAQVIHDFEVQEAISFHAGAYAAFSDLENLIHRRNPGMAAQISARLDALGQELDRAATQADAPAGDSIQAQADRLSEMLRAEMPAEWLEGGSAGDFEVVASLLDQMEVAVIGKDYAAAESARLEAYAIMEVGPEARLAAFAPQLKLTLEDLLWNGPAPHEGLAYLIKNRADYQEIQATRAELDRALAEAQTVLGASTAPLAVAVNAGMILFREGLEAVIILASLMSSLKRPDERRYRRPMWLGALGAFAATLLTWVLAHDVLQSLAHYGEKLEALVSFAAIIVLLVIMNWFFHKVYWTEWIAGFHARKRRILNGEVGLWLGLAALGFSSVYREGFETVLFLQALVLESGLAVVVSGAAAALAAVCLVGFATFRLQVHLPYKRMLVITGVLIGAVLLQMVGSTVHVFQVVGWLPIHAIGSQPLPYWLGAWFGVYATWEGAAAQLLAGAFVIGSYYLAEGLKRKKISDSGAGRNLHPTSS